MTIEITYKNCNRFVMMAGSLDQPEEMKDVLDFMDPLGVSEVESGEVTIDSHKDGAEVTITLKLVRVGEEKTPAPKPRKQRKPRKTRKAGSKSAPPPAYSEPPEAAAADEAEGDDATEDNAQEAAEAAQRFAKAKAAVRGAKKSNPPPADDDEADPLGDLEEALGGEAEAQPF